MESLDQAMAALKQGLSGEVVAIDLMAVNRSLGVITGDITTDDILNDVFSNFCIGK